MIKPSAPTELLAPAGDWSALKAAVINGADAVYFGLRRFNARARAQNFNQSELVDVVRYLHNHNCLAYLALNTVVFHDELEEAAQSITLAAEAGVDAIIVQDIGLLKLCRQIAPSLDIHASTQTTQTEGNGIAVLADLGVKRVILARELSVEEIALVAAGRRAQLEVFIHGAMCISYSGQCQASRRLWSRSSNRGMCGQACRLPYRIIRNGSQLDAPPYPLSPLDICAWRHVPDLVKIGVSALKIEGRLKDARYVAAATRFYRKCLDAALAGAPWKPEPQHLRELELTFSRGLCEGFLNGVDHRKLVKGENPANRGVKIATLRAVSGQSVVVELLAGQQPPKPGDGLAFDPAPQNGQAQGGRVYEARLVSRGVVALGFGRDDVDLSGIPANSSVWQTDDPSLGRALDQTFNRDIVFRRRPVDATVHLQAGGPMRVVLSDDAGLVAEASWPGPLAPSQGKSLDKDVLRRQLGRLGATPYELRNISILHAGKPVDECAVMAPASILNELRRQAVADLDNQRHASARHEVTANALETLRGPVLAVDRSHQRIRLHVLARTIDQVRAALSHDPAPATIYVDIADMASAMDALAQIRRHDIVAGGVGPQVLRHAGHEQLRLMAQAGWSCFLARNAGTLEMLKHAPDLTIVADHSFNAVNELSVNALVSAGATRVSPGSDVDYAGIAALAAACPDASLEPVIWGHAPMFHMAHCLPGAADKSANCSGCARPCQAQNMLLRDRLGVDHPVIAGQGACTVFHAQAQSGIEHLPAMISAGISDYRIEFVDEDFAVAQHVIHNFNQAARRDARA